MSITEEEGCDILERVFGARGYSVVRNFPFAEGGVTFDADGWDPDRRVGFEYLTREAADHDDMSREEYEALSARMLRGELFFFIIDEGEIEIEEDLVDAAHRFLDEVEKRGGGRGARAVDGPEAAADEAPAAPRRAATTRKPAAKKKPAGKKKGPAKKKAAGKKKKAPAKKKPAAKKKGPAKKKPAAKKKGPAKKKSAGKKKPAGKKKKAPSKKKKAARRS